LANIFDDVNFSAARGKTSPTIYHPIQLKKIRSDYVGLEIGSGAGGTLESSYHPVFGKGKVTCLESSCNTIGIQSIETHLGSKFEKGVKHFVRILEGEECTHNKSAYIIQ